MPLTKQFVMQIPNNSIVVRCWDDNEKSSILSFSVTKCKMKVIKNKKAEDKG